LTIKPPPGKRQRKKTTAAPAERPVIVEEKRLPSAAEEPSEHRADAVPFAERAGLGPANVAVLLECNAGFTEGMALMGQAVLGLTRETMQGAAETGLALIDSRSLPSAWVLGMQLARDQVERLLRGSAELTEIGWRTATATCEPLLSLARTNFVRATEGSRSETR